MVSIKLKFRPSTIEGKAGSLYYQVIYMRKVRQIATNFRITQSEWNPELEDLIIKDDDSSRVNYLQYMQNHIEYDKKCFNRIVKKLTISDSPFTVDTIVDEFHKQSFEITLFSYMEKMIAKLWRQGQHRTSETYQATLNSFRKFREGVDVCFDDIDSEMLISYEYHLRAKELAPNTISFYMKRLRAVYNNAVEDGYVENKNPFKKVFTSSEKTVKRAIPLKFVRKLKDLDLSYSPSKSFARDMFLFSFYTRGMAFVDMAYLKKKDLQNGVLVYRRQKTGQQLFIKWEKPMQEIVGKYDTSATPYLLPIIRDMDTDARKQYKNAAHLVNDKLKKIGRQLGLAIPLTSYVARHAWASIAKSKNIPISTISEAMGHDSENTTRIYLASLDTSVVDKANSLILKSL